MSQPTVYADFHNADSQGRLRLNCVGTIRDLAEKRIILTEGLQLTLSDDDLEVEAVVHFAEDERLWVAVIDWNAIRQRSA
jgi:hypothetical protein